MKTIQILLLANLTIIILAACNGGQAQPESFTIGVVNPASSAEPVLEGFKAGLAELGYVEGENVIYIYEGATGSIEGLDPAIQNVLAAEVDLIFSISTPSTIKTKKAVEGTDMPVVFAPVTDPVKSGIVQSLTNHDGNLTGIKVGGGMPKLLEWYLAIVPRIKHLFVFYHPNNNASVQSLAELQEAVAKQDVELIIVAARNSDELAAALENIPAEADGILSLPFGLSNEDTTRLVETAIDRKLPLASVQPLQQDGVPMSYSLDMFQVGKQAARLADKILQGTAPVNLPVEQADFFLGVNLQTAKAIGLNIPDDVLEQADNIVR